MSIKQHLVIAYCIVRASISVPLAAQEVLPEGNAVLETYIQEALQSNQGLKQVQLDYALNLAALKEARGLFLPDVSVNARYTMADGGRIITFPIGDLLNPVYSTLNLLTMSDQFPEVENEEFPFFRPKEHETKVRLVQPVFQSELIYNYRIRKQGSEIARIGVDRYKKELIREVTKAYYAFQKAHQFVLLSDTSMSLVLENHRVSKSLFDNDKVTMDAVFRSEAEISKVEVQQARAQAMEEASRAYFNFLLNRDLSMEIELIEDDPVPPSISLEQASIQALNNREELNQLKAYQDLNKQQTSLYRGAIFPGVYGVVDYGFQGEEYQFTGEDDFVMASVILQWQLFKGTVNHQKVQQSRIEGDKLKSMYEQAEQQIRLDVVHNYYALQAAVEAVESARTQVNSARRAYRLINRKYQEGQASLLELIDARTTLTAAASNVIIARSDYFSSLADFHYSTGYYSLENPIQ